MMPEKVALELVELGMSRTDKLDPQGLQVAQLEMNGVGIQPIKQLIAKVGTTPSRATPALGQMNELPLVKLQQQRPRRHVLQLPGSRIPVPTFSQRARQAPPAPARMRFEERLNLGNLLTADLASLNDPRLHHAAKLPDQIFGVQREP
jgi:hypothetical protein